MARGAVKAKQAQSLKNQKGRGRTKAQSGSRKRHASGGNPNQHLFFSRMRRRAKPAYLILAVLFAVTFAFLGVGSGANSGLDQLFSGLNIFGRGGSSVSKALKEVQKHPSDPKGFRDSRDRVRGEGRHGQRDQHAPAVHDAQAEGREGLERARRPAAPERAGVRDAVPERGDEPAARCAEPDLRGTGDVEARQGARHEQDRAGGRVAAERDAAESLAAGEPRLSERRCFVPEGRGPRAEQLERAVPARAGGADGGHHDHRRGGLQEVLEAQPELAQRQPDQGADQAARRLAAPATRRRSTPLDSRATPRGAKRQPGVAA